MDFRYCILDSCYLRDCVFIACNFTGCRFLSSNLRGSSFSGCDFAYATFEKTIISDDILERECPPRENQKANFARSLRTNYQQLGEAKSANKAIHVELQATKTHLYKAWHSQETYYRLKYANWARFTSFLSWSSFALLDVMWGNGESAPKLLRSLLLFFVFMAVYNAFRVEDAGAVYSYVHGFAVAPEVFLGTRTFPQYAFWYLTAVLATRLLLFAALTSIRVKDSVEYVWWLSKTAHPKASNLNVLREYSPDMIRLNKRNLRETVRPSGHVIRESFTKLNPGGAIPSNVIESEWDGELPESLMRMGNNSANDVYTMRCKAEGIKIHPARFPSQLPKFFIKMLTDEDDVVFDPFGGSLTTGAVAEKLERRWLAGEAVEEYLKAGTFRFEDSENNPKLF